MPDPTPYVEILSAGLYKPTVLDKGRIIEKGETTDSFVIAKAKAELLTNKHTKEKSFVPILLHYCEINCTCENCKQELNLIARTLKGPTLWPFIQINLTALHWKVIDEKTFLCPLCKNTTT